MLWLVQCGCPRTGLLAGYALSFKPARDAGARKAVCA